MSLLSSRGLRNMLIGAGSRALYKMDKVRADGEKGLEELKVAEEEVNNEVTNLKNTYDTALQVASTVGGGTFANFLFGTEDIEYIAAIANMAPDDKNEALGTLKRKFNNLDAEVVNAYGDYTKVSKDKYAEDVNRTKIDKGLKIKSNIGEDTTNFLSKTLFTTPKDIREKEEEIVGGFQAPALVFPGVTKGGFDVISTTPNIKVTQSDILRYLGTAIDGFNAVPVTEKTDTQLAFEKALQQDYLSLTNPQLGQDKRNLIINKYYTDVQRNKLDLSTFVNQTPNRTSTPDEEEEAILFKDLPT